MQSRTQRLVDCRIVDDAGLLQPPDREWLASRVHKAAQALRREMPANLHLPDLVCLQVESRTRSAVSTAEFIWNRRVWTEAGLVRAAFLRPEPDGVQLRLTIDPALFLVQQEYGIDRVLRHELIHAFTVEAFGAARFLFESIAERLSAALHRASPELLADKAWQPALFRGTCGINVPDAMTIGLSPAFHCLSTIFCASILRTVRPELCWRWAALSVTTARRLGRCLAEHELLTAAVNAGALEIADLFVSSIASVHLRHGMQTFVLPYSKGICIVCVDVHDRSESFCFDGARGQDSHEARPFVTADREATVRLELADDLGNVADLSLTFTGYLEITRQTLIEQNQRLNLGLSPRGRLSASGVINGLPFSLDAS